MSEVDKLYQNFEILNTAKEKILDHEKEYISIISAAAGSSSEKRLACQFIPKFFKDFPDSMNNALNAHLDLCEDSDPAIKRIAIKALPGFCNGLACVVPNISAVLTQMLFSEDPIEFNLVQTALFNLFTEHPSNTIFGIFDQMKNIDDISRSRALKFIKDNLLQQTPMKEKSVSNVLVDNLLAVIQTDNLENSILKLSISILNSPVLLKDNSDKISITIGDELKKIGKIILSDEKTCIRVHTLIEAAKRFDADGSSYENFLQHLFSCVSFLSDNETNVNTLAILRMAVGPCKIVKTDVESLLNLLYKSIYDFLPLPPKDVAPEDIEKTLLGFTYNWDYLEPLMMSLHCLYARYPTFMSWNVKDCEHIKLFREKLKFLLRIIQASAHVSKDCPTTIHPRIIAPGILTEEPTSQVQHALSKPQSTINSIIRSFLLTPPGVNLHYTVSWPTKIHNVVKIRQNSSPGTSVEPQGRKRILPPTASSAPSKVRISTELYRPPGARDPNSVQIVPPDNFKPTRGRGGNKWRGRRY